jgi:transcriptional regulator with XRE-family HTH domain
MEDLRDIRTGALVRALRHRLGWRQSDLAARVSLSQDFVSVVERGRLARIRIGDLRRILRALDADLVLVVRWRGGDLDRLVDEGHAILVGWIAGHLQALGWVVRPEVSYSEYGERGSIDLLAWHAPTRTLLVIEVKTELTSIEETLRKHDAKRRLSERIATRDLGWPPASIGALLVLPASATARRRVHRHEAVLASAYPMRGVALRRWLREPASPAAGILFVDASADALRGHKPGIGRKRIRVRQA